MHHVQHLSTLFMCTPASFLHAENLLDPASSAYADALSTDPEYVESDTALYLWWTCDCSEHHAVSFNSMGWDHASGRGMLPAQSKGVCKAVSHKEPASDVGCVVTVSIALNAANISLCQP